MFSEEERRCTYLSNIVEAVEDVFPRLLALDAGLEFMLFRGLESPERVGAIHVAVEELRCL